MNRSSLALIILFFGSTFAFGQSVARLDQSANLIPDTETRNDRVLAARAISALKRLDSQVIVYKYSSVRGVGWKPKIRWKSEARGSDTALGTAVVTGVGTATGAGETTLDVRRRATLGSVRSRSMSSHRCST